VDVKYKLLSIRLLLKTLALIYIGDFYNLLSIISLCFTPQSAIIASITQLANYFSKPDLEIRNIYMIFAFGADDHPHYC